MSWMKKALLGLFLFGLLATGGTLLQNGLEYPVTIMAGIALCVPYLALQVRAGMQEQQAEPVE